VAAAALLAAATRTSYLVLVVGCLLCDLCTVLRIHILGRPKEP
jgi:hypothetical protein